MPSTTKRHSRQDSLRENSPDKSGRSSFSSVRESSSDLAQTFTSSKVSSYSRLGDDEEGEEAIIDTPSPLSEMATVTTNTTPQFRPPVTQPNSRLHGCWFPAVAADGFQGWKQIDVKGKMASRSFGDLQALRVVWTAPGTPTKPKSPGRPMPGQSAIEKLPLELLGAFDLPPDSLPGQAS
jgi:hypothetical protein